MAWSNGIDCTYCTQAPSCSIGTQVLKSPAVANYMSASHHNVTCTGGEWAASNTFTMIASKVREGISGHGIRNFSG